MPRPSLRLVALACLALASPAALANELAPLFTSPVFDTGIGPNQVAIADFSGDGVPDAATANYGPGTVSLLVGNGQGGFLAPHDFAVGTYGIALVAGDLNGDGHADLVVGKDGASDVAVLLGNGAGGFAPALHFPVGKSPRAVAVGDLNGDSKLDAVAANYFSGSVSVLLGDGAGGFAPAVSVATGANPGSVALADVDNDGALDLLTANEGASNVSLRLGDGAGGFGAMTTFATGSQPSGIVVVDLDADGLPELATSNLGSSTITLRPNTGGGTFGSAITLAAGSGPSAIAAADLNGDGRPDLVVSNQANVVLASTVSVLLNAGGLAFGPKASFLVGPLAYDVTAADLDGDGHADLLAASGQSGLSVLMGDGSGAFPATATYGAGGGSARSMAAGHFDANPRADIAFVRPAGVGILLDNGTGGLAAPTALAGSAGAWSVACGDLDGDGRTDLVAGIGVPATLKAWLGDGHGGFVLSDSLGWPASSWDVALADVNRDGRLDVVSADRGISVAFGHGDGTFAAPATWAAPGVSRLKVGRVDADAWPDVVASGSQVLVLLNDGSGGFLPPTGLAGSSGPTDVALGDLDHDGHLDVVAGHLGGGFCSLWTGNGSGGFAPEQKVTIDYAPHAVWVADFDGDGDDDLAAAGYNSWTLALRRSDGTGGFHALETYTIATNAWTLVTGDFDGDNAPDLAIGNAEQGSITVALNTGAPSAWTDLGAGLAGLHGQPVLSGSGPPATGSVVTVSLSNAAESALAWLLVGTSVLDAPFKGGTLVPEPQLVIAPLLTDAHGDIVLSTTWPAGVPAGSVEVMQAWVTDAAGPKGFSASNGLRLVEP